MCYSKVTFFYYYYYYVFFVFQSGGGGTGRQERGQVAVEAEVAALCGQEVYRPWEVEIVSKTFFSANNSQTIAVTISDFTVIMISTSTERGTDSHR